MPPYNKRSCFCPGCSSGYPSERKKNLKEGKKNPSLFKAPKDPESLELWRRAIPRKDKVLQEGDVVCELHFLPSFIERNFDTATFPDGSSQAIAKGRPSLRPGSVPTIFPNIPKYLSKEIKSRKPPAPRQPAVPPAFNPELADQSVRQFSCEENPSMPLDHASLDHSYSYEILARNLAKVLKPNDWWTLSVCKDYIICAKWKDFKAEKTIGICQDLSAKVFLKDTEVSSLSCSIHDEESLVSLLTAVDNCTVCLGADKGSNCEGRLELNSASKKQPSFCSPCLSSRKKMFDLRRRQRIKRTEKKMKLAVKAKNALRKTIRLKKKVLDMKQQMQQLKAECAKACEEKLDEYIHSLPPVQQEAVKACFSASKGKNLKSMRYSMSWIYECLLLNIKSRRVYEHLRFNKILTLPSTETLRKYIKSIKGVYGFQNSVFEAMKVKGTAMAECERRGVILVDEMKLTEGLCFNTKELTVDGFVDLGPFDTHQAGEKGDHALVLMFQPFRGTWVQSLACFLSKGAASGVVLHQILAECIILMERAGFYVDAVTSDGATWNRKMWGKFGVDVNNVSCQHICDESRRLWFFSDFPHLVKTLRNSISSKKDIMTHMGPIRTKFWETVLELDNPKGFNLKVCPTLKYETIYPKPFQKMNVPLAFQFFGKSVIAGMELYKSHPNLQEAGSCIIIMKLLNKGIEAMNARIPCAALKQNSPQHEAIKDLYDFICSWEVFAKKENMSFISDSTCYGLKVTLKSTLELLHFLTNDCGYDYLMTARLNQDALERFFSMMRSAGGCNDHPDPHVFLQLYRLVSTYSLIKPPKGSNVAGEEILASFLQLKDVKGVEDRKKQWELLLDRVLDLGLPAEFYEYPEVVNVDHSYNYVSSNDCVVAYVAGYIARRVRRFTKCDLCSSLLLNPATDCGTHSESSSKNDLISLKSYGGLLIPSKGLFCLINHVEQTVLMEIANGHGVTHDLLFRVMEKLESGAPIPMIGCVLHKIPLTEAVLRFFIITRMHFVCRQENRNSNIASTKSKMHRKLAKLQ